MGIFSRKERGNSLLALRRAARKFSAFYGLQSFSTRRPLSPSPTLAIDAKAIRRRLPSFRLNATSCHFFLPDYALRL
jgi:hypothetical protein